MAPRRRKLKKKAPKPKKVVDVDEQIVHAVCSLRMNSIRSHHLQGEVTQWICDNYGFITPETVQRVFRRMANSPDHVINKVKEGRFVRYEIVKLFDLRFDKDQPKLF